MDKKRAKDKLTILIDKDIKERYREYCDSKGLILGKQIEIFLEKELERLDKEEARKK